MQMFSESQKLNCARLSVPKDNRRRDRFNGTQNSLFQTMNNADAMAMAAETPQLQMM